ncbi:hypothetical protein AB5I41_31765 [Sphingomonas sp. MMS24-JH45]
MSEHRIRRFREGDRAAMEAFAQGLPDHDLLFLGCDAGIRASSMPG